MASNNNDSGCGCLLFIVLVIVMALTWGTPVGWVCMGLAAALILFS